MALAQQLANLAHQCGRAGALQQYSPDLLSAMQVKSQQAAAALNDRPEQGFHYQQALQYLPSLNARGVLRSQDICALHRQLNPLGGQLRHVKPRLPLRYIEGEYLQTACTTAAIEGCLEQLLQQLHHALADGVDPLVAIPLFGLDFMRIFPFLDGNRRMLLLLTRHLLSRHGHPVMACVDIESEIAATEKAFYQSLYHSSQPDQVPLRWLTFWWVVLMRVYQRFNRQVQQAGINRGRGAKTALVKHFISQQKEPFLFTDISAAFPTIGTDMIRVVLRRLRDQGLVQASGRGRGARWTTFSE